MSLNISVSTNEKSNYSKNWDVVETKSAIDLLEVVKTKAYSNAIFEKGKNRSSATVIGLNQLLILDIDNDTTNFTINDCKNLFYKNNIASLIVPSRSHNKEKNGVIKDRYRVFCFVDQALPHDINKEDYKFIMSEIVKDLQMEEYVDKKALFDKSRLYYPTQNLDESIICKTKGKEICIDTYLKKLRLHNNQVLLLGAIRTMRLNSKKSMKKVSKSENKKSFSSSSTKKVISANTDEHFIYDGIYQYNITDISKAVNFSYVIDLYETILSREENNEGTKIKTANKNTYQHFHNTGILYDFKNEISFHLFSYIKNFHNCSNSQEVLDYMRELTIVDNYRSVNETWQTAMIKALDISTSYKELNENLISMTGFSKINIMKDKEDSVIVAGKKFHLSDFGLQDYTTKSDIIKKFQEKRVGKKTIS